MAVIKSALELALERTKDLQLDESAQKLADARIEGRKAASQYLEDQTSVDFKAILNKLEPVQRQTFLTAAFEVLINFIQLPTNSVVETEKMESIGKAIVLLCGLSPRFSSEREVKLAQQQARSLYQQILRFLSQYQEEMKRVEQAIRNQWAPKLRERERQLAAALGQNVRIDPMSDPEFAEFYRKNIESMRNNYGKALEDAKKQLADTCGFESK
ncbi:MAG TPA: hypothetical protein PK105_03240 [Rectinema sp.]|mgnify:FL=1|jgi:hypothetical protein|nr:hypothetical protein [Spirochaetia bacterium]MDI9428080.1 hypothetical protein [Spirochaetota bacterium]NLH90797.1 hypothetical protein [Treponema sp.]HNP93555.1 hypothetical protein [Rectinema sp.]HNT59309.1 hypothetical protein [Rectinema sp.]